MIELLSTLFVIWLFYAFAKEYYFKKDDIDVEDKLIRDCEEIERRESKRNQEKKELKQIQDFYIKYINSDEWNRKRKQRKIIDNFTCQECNSTLKLTVHHKSYANLGNEEMSDLITLCWECHQDLHNRVGYPDTVDAYKHKIFW